MHPTRAKGTTKLRRWLLPAALLALLLGTWQIAASTGAIAEALSLEPYLVPSPSEIAQSLLDNRGLLAENAWVTLREMVIGIACGIVLGSGIAALMHRWRLLRDAAYPLIVATQTVPVVVIAPILTVWFGYGLTPKVVIVALVSFFPITVAIFDGLRSVDPEAVKLMRSLDASRRQLFWRVEAPSALPNLFTGTKIAVVFAPLGAVFAEWAGSSSGLGHLIQSDTAQFEVARQFATVAVLAAMALALMGLTTLVERRVVAWR